MSCTLPTQWLTVVNVAYSGDAYLIYATEPVPHRLWCIMARPTVTFPFAQHHRRLAGNKSYCSMTQVDAFEQLRECRTAGPFVWSQAQRISHNTITIHNSLCTNKVHNECNNRCVYAVSVTSLSGASKSKSTLPSIHLNVMYQLLTEM